MLVQLLAWLQTLVLAQATNTDETLIHDFLVLTEKEEKALNHRRILLSPWHKYLLRVPVPL